MVGVPRSTGCATCVKRRVKCDETKPHCSRCQKSGRQCPGYTKRFVFKQSSLAASRPKPDAGDSVTPQESQLVPWRHEDAAQPHQLVLDRQYNSVISFASPMMDQTQLMGNLITAFTMPGIRNLAGPQQKPWMVHVYDKIGTSPPLDLSMRSLALLYHGQECSDTRISNSGRSLYINALRSIRDDLSSGRSSHSDIQSAVMLLTFYELLSNRTEEAWIKHSGGSSEIMRLRGPQAYTSGVDYSMYLVCRSYIMVEAFVMDKPCFLEEPAWEALTRISKVPHFLLQERMYVCHAKAPRILSDAQKANSGEHDAFEVLNRAYELRETMKACFADWWNSLESMSLAPTARPSGDPLFPNSYWFQNILTAGLTCSHYTVLILLNHLLIDSGIYDTNALVEECRRGAEEICKCVCQAQTRLVGTMYMPFWLRVAIDACDPQYRPWITSKLEQLQAVHGNPKGGKKLPLK